MHSDLRARLFRNGRVAPPPELLEQLRWYALYTQARHERKVAHQCREQDIEVYLPEVGETRQWSDRRKRVIVPLFPGYLFVRERLNGLTALLDLPSVATVVQVNGYPTPVPDEEIAHVRRLLEGLASVGQVPQVVPRLATGDPVRVIAGPCRGVEGVVEELRGSHRVLVSITPLRQSLVIEVRAEDLKLLN